jgi:hypothetical protein
MSAMNLSRFADPKRTQTIDLGECRCPGAPHGNDTAEVRAEIGDGEFHSAVGRGGWSSGAWNGQDSDNEVVATFTKRWTLLDAEGQPAPITAAMVVLLDEATRMPLLLAISEAADRKAKLPNASGDPSPDSSPGSGSPRRTARTRK